jgi:hypothetical protein
MRDVTLTQQSQMTQPSLLKRCKGCKHQHQQSGLHIEDTSLKALTSPQHHQVIHQ